MGCSSSKDTPSPRRKKKSSTIVEEISPRTKIEEPVEVRAEENLEDIEELFPYDPFQRIDEEIVDDSTNNNEDHIGEEPRSTQISDSPRYSNPAHMPPPPTATPRRGILKSDLGNTGASTNTVGTNTGRDSRNMPQSYHSHDALSTFHTKRIDEDFDDDWEPTQSRGGERPTSSYSISPSSLAIPQSINRPRTANVVCLQGGQANVGYGQPKWNTGTGKKRQVWESDFKSDYYY